jgi:hypothetical protein
VIYVDKVGIEEFRAKRRKMALLMSIASRDIVLAKLAHEKTTKFGKGVWLKL